MREVLTKWGAIDVSKFDSQYNLMDDPIYLKIDKVKKQFLMKKFRMKPEENYTVIYTIAAHGILRDGKQTVLINEYDKKTGFYKVWNVEANIRLLASTFHNTYHIAFFACCREFYNSARHTGCFA